MVQDLHEDMGPWVPGLLNPKPVSAETRMGTPTGREPSHSKYCSLVEYSWHFPLLGTIMPKLCLYTPNILPKANLYFPRVPDK